MQQLEIAGAGEKRPSIQPTNRRASSVNFITAIPAPNNVQGGRFNESVDEKHQQLIKKRVRQSLNQPVGVLAVHIKNINFITLSPTGLITNPEMNVYLRILVGQQIKCTCEYQGVVAPTNVVMSELKHFNIQVSPKRRDPSNYMRMELVGFAKEKPLAHIILAMKEIHLYEIIKRLYAVENLKMYRLNKRVADVDLEFCFGYGVFGYGYANQFENRQKPPREQVQHSMFYREEPAYERVDTYRNIMLPRPIGHPSFIYFSKKVEIGDTVNKYKSDMSVHDWQTMEEPVLLNSRIRRKMHRLYSEYSEQPSRKGRLQYLRNMIQNHACQSNINEGVIEVSDKFKLRKRQHRHQKKTQSEDVEADDKTVYATEDIEAMAQVMEQAPGIVGRVRDIRSIQKKVEDIVVEPENVRRQSVAQMIGDGISRVLGGIWRGGSEKAETPSTDTITSIRSTTEPTSITSTSIRSTTEPTSTTSAKLSREVMAGTSGLVRRRPTHQQVSPLVEEEPGDTTAKDEMPPMIGRCQQDINAATRQRRTSITPNLMPRGRRPSVLESAATRLRGIMTQKIEEQSEMIIPRVTITPCTPDISDYSEEEDDQ